ncbi:hypothetical protein Pyn_16095 [Prunus yedoensis var. nudiflora]|uniref:Uncharacterized protein n=1 Tax=Prunus yedoensis var. nudiflora TaxID=2094558 RepID=A0A314Z1N8_PRUYE|nr:hypothetical protein Pyn_16095 [Prunus yedoensis var. nudiflora]
MEESNTRSKLKRICVYWESNFGHRKVFGDAALEYGNKLEGLGGGEALRDDEIPMALLSI